MTGHEDNDPDGHIGEDGLPKISGVDSSSGAGPDETPGLTAGQVIDGFEILEEIGRGGMGVVYRAYEKRLRRVLALKVLYPSVAEDSMAAKRFRQEAVVAANLSHPNIVPVFHIDQREPPRYFTMEFVEGVSIDEKVAKEGALPPAEAARIALQAADALDCAHRHQIIHRDIKPGNILLQDGLERVRITDFGIAQNTGSGSEEPDRAEVPPGTLAFMSPEQCLGETVDARSDIFSLGLTLYYMLTGRVAYQAGNRKELAVAFREQAVPPPDRISPEVDEALDAIVMKMTVVDAGQRYQSARAVAEALETYLEDRARIRKPRKHVSPRARRWLEYAAGAGFAIALLVGVIVIIRPYVFPRVPAPLRLKHFIAGIEGRPGYRSVRGVALSPDESRLYAAHWQSGTVRTNDLIAVYSTVAYSLVDCLVGGQCVGDIVTSNDGRYVYAPEYYGGYIHRYDTRNGNAKNTIDLGSWARNVWISPDGKRIIVQFNAADGSPSSRHRLALVDISGDRFSAVDFLETGRPIAHGNAAFSDDGRHMYLAAR